MNDMGRWGGGGNFCVRCTPSRGRLLKAELPRGPSRVIVFPNMESWAKLSKNVQTRVRAVNGGRCNVKTLIHEPYRPYGRKVPSESDLKHIVYVSAEPHG